MPNPGGDRVGGGVWHAFSFGETPVRRFGQPIRLEDRGQNPEETKSGEGFWLTKRVAQRRQSDVGQPSRLEGCWEGRTIHPE